MNLFGVWVILMIAIWVGILYALYWQGSYWLMEPWKRFALPAVLAPTSALALLLLLDWVLSISGL